MEMVREESRKKCMKKKSRGAVRGPANIYAILTHSHLLPPRMVSFVRVDQVTREGKWRPQEHVV